MIREIKTEKRDSTLRQWKTKHTHTQKLSITHVVYHMAMAMAIILNWLCLIGGCNAIDVLDCFYALHDRRDSGGGGGNGGGHISRVSNWLMNRKVQKENIMDDFVRRTASHSQQPIYKSLRLKTKKNCTLTKSELLIFTSKSHFFPLLTKKL